jgi:hypothetical protein
MPSFPRNGTHEPNRSEAEGFCIRFPSRRVQLGRAVVSYTPDEEYGLLQLLLYVLSFVAVVLIFFYIASERPAEKKKKEEEED